METGLRLVVQQCVRILSAYLLDIPPENAKDSRLIQFHMVQAKQALMKCIQVRDPHDFMSRRLIKVYDEQLRHISEQHSRGE